MQRSSLKCESSQLNCKSVVFNTVGSTNRMAVLELVELNYITLEL